MDEKFRQQLRKDAAAGNKVAERLLLNSWLAEENHGEINAFLANYPAGDSATGKQFLEAELRCLHNWPGDKSWQALLRECCDAGHVEARFVSSVYHEWARFSGFLPPSGSEAIDSWEDGWSGWTPPDWTTVLEKDGVRVEQSGGFVPRSLVGFLRSVLGPQLRPSAVVDPESGRTIAHPVRINQYAQWLPEHLGWAGKLFECRLAETSGYTVSHGEALSLLHYRPGQRYKAHLDCIPSKQVRSAEGQEQGGQRILTVLLALGDDDYTGGETNFPRLQGAVKAATGELLRFNNADADGQALPASLHEGCAIDSGEKWLLSKWVRQQSTPYGRETSIICPGEN
jgi:hypothetical protein